MGFLGIDYFFIKRKGKVLFQVGDSRLGEPKRELTPEEKAKAIQEGREHSKRMSLEMREDKLDYYSGVPSSKEGRDKYFATINWELFPFFLIHRAWAFLMGRRYWYSKHGRCREID